MSGLNFYSTIVTGNGHVLLWHRNRGCNVQTTWTLTLAAAEALVLIYPERRALLTEYLYWENYGWRGEVDNDRIAAFRGVSVAKLREDIEALQARAFVKAAAIGETIDG